MTSSRPLLTRRSFLSTTAAGTTLAMLHPFSAFASAGQAHLRIMETTDLHVHVYPYDYYSDREVDTVGLARTAAHVHDIRAEAEKQQGMEAMAAKFREGGELYVPATEPAE